MLTLRDIGARRGGEAVLDRVSLHVAAGETVVLMGRSGIGKTTLLHAAAGLLPIAAGHIARGGRLAMVFQEPRLLAWHSLLDNAALGLKAQGMPRRDRHARAGQLLLELGLREADLAKPPRALSGGMQQRVAIARALAIDPAILLLDEPFAALDPGLRAELQEKVRAVVARRRLAVLMVTHDLVEAVRLGGRLVVLSGRPARIARDMALPPVPGRAAPATLFGACAELLRVPEVADGLGLSATDHARASTRQA